MLHTNKNLYLVTFLLFMILVVSVGTFLVYGASSSPSTFLKGSTPYGVSYEDWITKWWQWNMQTPKEQHPAANPDFTKCTIGQLGSVVFLTHGQQGKSQYTCTIPAGLAIMIPISTGECTSHEAKSSVLADMIKCATEGDKYLTFEAAVDGVTFERFRSELCNKRYFQHDGS